ncbi:hypothetical protein [Scytonema sp. NUACC26]|uniref:hypothetical protein n=1 Tax=Scytonema sp. NUACC26 TaxID=3140176 RepID=UPI0034DC902B
MTEYMMTAHGILKIYADKNKIELFSHDFINPEFNLAEFDKDRPHTSDEWKDYFFTVNEECKIADNLPSVTRINLHMQAVQEYIQRKAKRNLVIYPGNRN